MPRHTRPLLPHLCLFGLWWLMSVDADAVEHCVDDANLVVPATTEGLYVNLITGVSGQTEASVPGFDVDPYASASAGDQLRFYWGAVSTGGAGVATMGDVYAVLAPGAVIGPQSVFTRAGFSGDTSAWQAGVAGYLGARFRDETSQAIWYGWLKLTTTAPLGFPLTINGWCYEDSGAAITIPEQALFKDGFE